jgi:hypothetical protein
MSQVLMNECAYVAEEVGLFLPTTKRGATVVLEVQCRHILSLAFDKDEVLSAEKILRAAGENFWDLIGSLDYADALDNVDLIEMRDEL